VNTTIHISKVKLHDEYAVIQRKKDENNPFTHVTIYENSWSMNIGGGEDKYQIKELQELGYNISKNGTITRENIESAFDIIKNGYLKYSIFGLSSNRENIPIPFLNKYCNYTRDNVIGHFVIKAPDGSYAMCIYNDGQNLSRISKLEKREYLSVPNHP
jgi:predicted ATP-dependent protease